MLRDVGLNDEARAEGGAALAVLRTRPKPEEPACGNRFNLLASALAEEGTGNDVAASRNYGELVDLGGVASRRQDCRKCHQEAGAAIAGGLRDWWAGPAYARAVQRSGQLKPTVAATEQAKAAPGQEEAARLRLAYLYPSIGRGDAAESAWAEIGEPRAPVVSRK